MSFYKRNILSLVLIAIILSEFSSTASIPEPGFIMYGSSLNSGSVAWQVSSTTASVAVNSTTINVNGQNFYVATVTFETRSIGDVPIGPATPNSLQLLSAPTTYARLAIVNGTNATVTYASSGVPNSFTFGPADRGRVEEVDLAVNPSLTFAQWLVQYGLPPNSDPNSDPTHKGMTLEQQFVAGLNPNDPNSVFKFVGILPVPQGVEVQWSSETNETYSLLEGTALNGPFTAMQTNIVATPGTNTFILATPTNGANLFIRVSVNQ